MLYILTWVSIPISIVGLIWLRDWTSLLLLLGIWGIAFKVLGAVDSAYLEDVKNIKEKIEDLSRHVDKE